MNTLLQRTTDRVVPLVMLLVLPLLVGGVVAYAGLPGALALLGIAVAALVLHLLRGSAVHIAALAVCAAIIVYPAFLPRSTSEIGTFTRATTSSRAQVQLLVIVGLMVVAGWLWLSTPGSIAVLTRAPFNLFACYSGMILLSLIYTPDKAWSIFAILKLFEAFLAVAVLAVLVKTLGQLRRVVNVMLGAIGVVLVVFWLDVVGGNATVQDFTGRFTTSWLHANTTTLMAFTFASMMVARFFTASAQRIVRNAAILACFGAITGFIAGGKTALVGGTVAVALCVAIIISKRVNYSRINRLLLMGCG